MVQGEGRYLFGVAAGERKIRLGRIGLEAGEVYAVPCDGICAIVQHCAAEHFRSSDEETVKKWIRTHQSVLDEAKKVLGSVIPAAFGTILQSRHDAITPDRAVRDWLERESRRLLSILKKISGRDEYGVQIFYDSGIMTRQISEENREIQRIKAEMASTSVGAAYLYQQKVERITRAELERLANGWFQSFYDQVKRHCDDIEVEKTRQTDPGKLMLLNFSCLVASDRVGNLGEELEKINKLEGFSVRFSGPWPPYSFVAKPVFAGWTGG